MKHPVRDWYPPSMTYTYNYIVWLLQHMPYLMAGLYLRDPRDTGYTEGPGSRHVSTHAPFERAVIIGAELMVRLGRCDDGRVNDGLLAQARYTDGKSDKEIAKQYHLPTDEVTPRIVRAICYAASGKLRRWDSHFIDCRAGVCRPETYRQFRERKEL